MIAHWHYLKYVLVHKWFVFLARRKMGVPLWQGILHDWTRFTRREWTPYVYQFFNPDGTPRKVRDASGAYDPNAQSLNFRYAWLYHQRNKHHWQAWISIGNGGKLSPLPIPEMYIREMIADWIGAGRAITGSSDPRPWYEQNKGDMVIHPDSRALLESLLP